jgi:hypothetical protein
VTLLTRLLIGTIHATVVDRVSTFSGSHGGLYGRGSSTSSVLPAGASGAGCHLGDVRLVHACPPPARDLGRGSAVILSPDEHRLLALFSRPGRRRKGQVSTLSAFDVLDRFRAVQLLSGDERSRLLESIADDLCRLPASSSASSFDPGSVGSLPLFQLRS